MNNELQATLEELASTNEELSAVNNQLNLTNQKLANANTTIREQSEIIIQQKNSELTTYRNNLDIIFTNTQEGILLLDDNGRVRMFNNTYAEFIKNIANIQVEEGLPFLQVVAPARRAIAKQLLEDALLGKTTKTEAVFKISETENIVHALTYQPVWQQGKISHVILISYDITEKKRQENIITQSEANLKAIFDNTDNSFLLLSPDFTIIAFNRAYFQNILLQSNQELKIGTNMLEYISLERRTVFESFLERAKEGETINYDIQFEFKENPKWFNITINSIKSTHGELTGYCITTLDTSNIKLAELDLRRSEEKFRALVENSDDIFSLMDEVGNLFYASPSFTKILGYSGQEILGLTGYQFIHPNLINEYVLKFQEVLANPGKLVNILTQVKHKDGHWLWIEGTAVNLFHLESVKGIVGTFRDVTQQVSMEEEARQNAFFREKANEVANIGYGIAEINSMGEKITWSQEALQILGLNKEEYDGSFKSYLKIVHPDDLSIVRRAILHAVNVSGQYSLDHRIIHSNGAIRWVHDIAEVKKDKDNSVMIGILQDITERKEIELILKEFNERYDILSKATNDAIWDWDIPNDFQLWNHGLQTIFGYRETIIKKVRFWIQKKIHPDDFNTVIRSLEDSFTSCHSNWSAIYRYQCYDGTYKHVQDRAYILYDKNHKPIRAIGAMQDITKQYYSTLEIKKLSLVASSTDNAVVITDTQDNIEWVNQSFEKLTGFTLAEVEGKNHIDLLRSTDMPEDVMNNIQLKLTRWESITAEINNTTRSGKRYWFKLAITPVLSVEGELQNYVSIYTDISNQKDYENKLTSIAQELQGLIENSNVPIFGIDVNGIINEWNHITATITEYSKNEALGQPWTSFLEVKYRDTIHRLITKILKGKSVNNFELPILSKSGDEVILLLSASPRWDAETVIKGVIIVAQNITELSEYRHGLEQMVQERTRELNIALQKEKELVVFKSRFVSIASHEFKTPLTTISLASGFLRKYKQKLKPEDIDEKLNAIDKQIDHMNYLLEDVLTIGKSESGKIDINLTSIDIKSFFTALTRDIQQGIPQTNRINLTIKNFKSTIMTDPKMLRVIVVNLLTNAIKFSPINTAVEMEVRYTKKHLLIKIIDYGLGIPSKDIDNLFTSFYRGSNVGAIQGTGLGLSIVKKTVDLLKGWVKVESKVGHGSTFTVSLPTLL